MDKFIKKFNEIRNSLSSCENKKELEGIVDRTAAVINKYYGKDNEYTNIITDIYNNIDIGMLYTENYNKVGSLINLVIDDLELSEKKEDLIYKPMLEEKKKKEIIEEITELNNKVFIVHGHNEIMKQSVARIIEKLDLEPIILHEQANQGMTIIEKFLNNSNVGFSIILLSADDIGYSKKDGNSSAKDRARQNVIFELGFFTAKLGRKRVVALVENSKNFEIPSDVHGVIYIPFEGIDGKWKFDIAKELMESGYNLDVKKII